VPARVGHGVVVVGHGGVSVGALAPVALEPRRREVDGVRRVVGELDVLPSTL
jgi:hypothetical protein